MSSKTSDAEKQPLLEPQLPSRPRPKLYKSCTFIPLAFLTLVVLSFLSFLPFTYRSSNEATSSTVKSGTDNPAYLIKSRHGAVASEHRDCSDIGVRILKEGGNALDAAIASSLCIGVVNPFSSGIGGGGFMTVRLPPTKPNGRSEVWSVDFREKAPAAAHTDMYKEGTNSSRFGGLAVGIPGEIRGFEEAHRRWGSLPWKELFLPSVALAEGFNVGAELARRLPWFIDVISGNPDWEPIFAPNGVLLKEFEILRNANLSKTLSKIAHEGPDAFYKGSLTDSFVRKIQATGGIITHKDLANYTVDIHRSLEGTYLDKKIYVPKAPSSGPVLLHMLNIIEHYNFSEHSAVNTHRVVESLKYGFAARTRLSDPLYRDNLSLIHEIPTKAFSDAVYLNLTDDRTHTPDYYNPQFDVKMDHGTQHVSVVDQHGMAVALTSSVNGLFGSLVLDSETGVIFNNQMDDFSVPGTPNIFGLWPSPYNYPEPFKRPLSSIVPAVIERTSDNSFYAAFGGSGGSIIFGAMFQVMINMVHWGMDLSEAVEAGRVHDQLYPSLTLVDDTYPEQLVKALVERGHNVTILDVNRVAGVINTVMQDEDGVIYAASDSRKNGIAAGF
ncbi:gamma-glutamyltranspeptidase [Marasmius fiardii PR-910]|nr:gamma-glutamyltranspeptidase [Marasmius fiardii PR-910]